MKTFSAPRWVLLLLLPLVLLGAGGCNTVEGAGEDIQSGGEAISDTADDVKDEIND